MKFKIFGKTINLSILNKEEKIITNQEDTVKNTIYSPQNNYITIIFNNGDIIADKIEKEQVNLIIRGITTKKEVLNLLEKEEIIPTKEDTEENIKDNLKSYLHLFKDSEDFTVLGDNVYFKTVNNIPIPSSIVASFLEILDKGTDTEEYLSLKYFTLNLLMNPIESAREDCLQFVKDNDIKITSNGLLVCYRRIVSKENTNKEWNSFVSENYIKVKKWKKNPANYEIYKFEDELFISNKDSLDYDEHLGNLKDSYISLATTTENIYTDNYTHKKQIKIGTIYREDEDKIDLDNTKDCSNGLKCVVSL